MEAIWVWLAFPPRLDGKRKRVKTKKFGEDSDDSESDEEGKSNIMKKIIQH